MDAYSREPSEAFLSLKRRFGDFFEDHQPYKDDRYVERIEQLLSRGEKRSQTGRRLVIDVHDLQQFDDKLHQELLKNPADAIRPCLDAAKDAAKSLHDGQFADKFAQEIEVRSPPRPTPPPRSELTRRHILTAINCW
jgi:DNA replicative helicase MCM subunit Mcm2 (Cdc46/Mcm family)